MFYGRRNELDDLEELYKQNKFQLFILYGRRRVGKTSLLNEFCKDKPSIFFAAEQSSEKLNLEKFSSLILQHYGDDTIDQFASFEKAITYVHRRQEDSPLVLVFDEFPYLAELNPALLSMLQHLIDHTLQDGKLFIVLCGSYMGFMEDKVLSAKSPLYGRRTAQFHMKAFDYATSMQFLDGFTDEEKLIFYGVCGGIAPYLLLVERDRTMQGNIERMFLSTTGYLYDEPQLLLRQEVKEPSVYNAIIEVVANGATRANEISTKTGEATAKCLKYMSTLQELGIIEKITPFGEKDSSRKSLYRISDFMFRFWYRYVAGNRTLLEMGAKEMVWEKWVLPDLSNYMGQVFERICTEYLLRVNVKGELPFIFTKIGGWWGTNPKTRSEKEIDIVASGGDSYLFCECKWRNELLDFSVLENLRRKSALVNPDGGENWYMLFSKSGFTESVKNEAEADEHLALISIPELMAV